MKLKLTQALRLLEQVRETLQHGSAQWLAIQDICAKLEAQLETIPF